MTATGGDDWKEAAFARWKEQIRREMQQRADAGICTLYLDPADEEGGPFTPHFQSEIDEFRSALDRAQVDHRAPFMAMDSVEAVSGYTGEFLIATSVITAFITASGSALAAYLASRSGRRVRMKMGDDEVEARSTKELTELLELMKRYKSEQKDDLE